MHIEQVNNAEDLDAVLQLVDNIFPQINNGEYRYSRDFWLEQMNDTPDLLLYATDGSVISGAVFAHIENNAVTIGHCCVAGAHRGQGVGRALMAEIERRVRDRGYRDITLGSVEGAEGFYEKLGYTGSLLVQSEEHGIEELKSLNETYEVIGTSVYGGTVNQIWLQLPLIDRQFQRKYERELPGCDTRMTFGKTV